MVACLVLVGFWLAGMSTASVASQLGITPAVRICWDSQANKLYQLQASDEMAPTRWTSVGAPVTGTGAQVCTMLVSSDAAHRFFRVLELAGTATNWLAGLSELDLRPAKLTAQDGGFIAEGARVTSTGISINDLVTTHFQFDMESQSLKLVGYQVVTNIGVFNGRFFAKNMTVPMAANVGGTSLEEFRWYSLSGSNIVINFSVEEGHVFNFGLRDQSREYSLERIDADGQVAVSFNGAANLGVVWESVPVLKRGTQQIRLRSHSAPPGTSLSCQFYFAINNATTLTLITNGSPVSATFRQNTDDYAKFVMNLTRGQVVRLPRPNAGIGFQILNARSESLTDVKGLPLICDVPADGTYYLFIYKVRPADGEVSYGQTLNIGN